MAAIHRAAHQGADVRWNDTISGRQFDVTVRFKHGLYDYLTVVECRDRRSRVKAEHVDALTTKARDVGANRAVLASTSDFQSGAIDVARRHSISLLRVTENYDRLDRMLQPESPVIHVKSVILIYRDGSLAQLPTESNALDYYTRKLRVGFENASRSLASLIDSHIRKLPALQLNDEYIYTEMDCPIGARIFAPSYENTVDLKPITKIGAKYAFTTARGIVSGVQFEKYLLTPDIQLEDVVAGQRTVWEQSSLPLGLDTELKEGHFYQSPTLEFFYYCRSIDKCEATVWLVESFQVWGAG